MLEVLQALNNFFFRWKSNFNSGFNCNPLIDYAYGTDIGSMNIVCPYSKTLSARRIGQFMLIFRKSTIGSRTHLKSLLTGQHSVSKQFLDALWSYNSAFQFTSFGANELATKILLSLIHI